MEIARHQRCLLCGSSNICSLKGYEKHMLARCRSCGFVFMERNPSIEELEHYYSTYTYDKDHALSPATAKSYHLLLDEFEKYRKLNRILDSGCGLGHFLTEARKRGWEVYGTEFSKAAVERCTSKGINMKTGALSPDMFPETEFDVITSFEVIEHINNPHDELKAISQLLRQGGLFYCTTPNFNSLLRFMLKENYNIIEYPEHLSYYTRSTLGYLARMHGLKPVKFLSTGFSFSRLSASTSVQSEKIRGHSTDEKLRNRISRSVLLSGIKSLANQILTITRTGLTLKGYFEKT